MSIEHLQIRKFDIKEMDLNSKVAIIGKPGCFAKGTEILMFDGSIKNVENVKLGDVVMGDDNTARNVLDVIKDREEMFKISRKSKKDIIVNLNHYLVLMNLQNEIIEIKVKDYINSDLYKNYFWITSNKDYTNKFLEEFTIESIGDGDYYGFTLDGNHRFLLSDFSVVRNSGKSWLIKDLLYRHRKDFASAIVMSGTEGSTGFYRGMAPDLFIFHEYNQSAMDRIRIRQQRAVRENGAGNPENNCAVVCDDCMDDKDWIKHKTTKWLFKNGRHFDVFFLLAMQYALDIPPELRTCIDYIFICKEPQLKTRHKLHDNYAGMIPTFNMFCDILDNLTEDYHCMVIKNRKALSPNITDCVFWYKAQPHEDEFSIVPRSVWRWAEDHYNSHYLSDEEEQELKQTTAQKFGRGGKKKTHFVVSKLQY